MEASQASRARALVTALAKRDLLEARRVEIVARDFAAHVEALARAPSARELERWLETHPQVTELSASDDALDELLGEFLAPPKPPPVTVRNPELEREIYQSAEPERAIAVYSDWLLERNDPFGEQLALGLSDPAQFTRYLRDNAARILGDHHRELAPLRIDWVSGLIDMLGDLSGSGLDYRPVEPAAWGSLLRTRSCEMLRQITLQRSFTSELDATLAEHAPPGLMSVVLGDVSHYMPRLARRPFFKLYLSGHTIDANSTSFHPELKDLTLRVGDLEIHGPVSWNIRSLHLPWVKPSLISTLRKIHLPRLERLTATGEHEHLLADFPAYTLLTTEE